MEIMEIMEGKKSIIFPLSFFELALVKYCYIYNIFFFFNNIKIIDSGLQLSLNQKTAQKHIYH